MAITNETYEPETDFRGKVMLLFKRRRFVHYQEQRQRPKAHQKKSFGEQKRPVTGLTFKQLNYPTTELSE
jgi:hypothetical protein